MTHLATPARLLKAAERHSRVENVIAVDPHGTSTQLRGGCVGFVNVARPDGGSKPVDVVVRSANQVITSLEWNGGDHRSEDFFADNLHLLVGIYKDRGLDEVTLRSVTLSADPGLRAFL